MSVNDVHENKFIMYSCLTSQLDPLRPDDTTITSFIMSWWGLVSSELVRLLTPHKIIRKSELKGPSIQMLLVVVEGVEDFP